MSQTIPVLTAPLIDPGQARKELNLPEGLSLTQMVEAAFPGLPKHQYHLLRVVLVTPLGAAAIDARYWTGTRPKAGVRVVIRMVPGKDAARSILMAVVSVAALALAGPFASLLGFSGALATSVVAAGLTVVGGLLVNALVPMPEPEQDSRKNSYAISGWQNTARLNEAVPDVYGRHRTAPPFAATSYSEIVGDQQYIRAMFCLGYGPLKVSDIRIGNTSIDEYDEVELELREGRPGDAPLSLYPQQVLEQAEGIELVRPPQYDDAGVVIDGPNVETPVVRQTAADTQDVNVILSFPQGLYAVDDKGRKARRAVRVRIRQRLKGDIEWQDVETLDISALNPDMMYRQHRWQLPARGKWDIEVTRLSDDSTDGASDQVTLAALQSIRPEYPLNIDKPLALIALRIRATHQLNSALDNLNAIVERYATRWDGTSWSEGLSRNPAAAFITLLKGPSNPFPIPDAQIDWEGLRDWFEWCEAKGLKYDHVIEAGMSFGDLQREICAAGRAFPRHDGVTWGVVIDRATDLVVDHISPRNSEGFSWSRTYFDPPHAFRVTFFDESDDYAQAERIIPWPGHVGDITITEEIQIPGKTDPHEIWVEARRRMYELIHRPDTFTTAQSGAARVVTRGDLVMGSYDVLSRDQVSGRVLILEGNLLELDADVTAQDGVDLGIRFRVYADEADVIGTSVVRALSLPVPGTQLIEIPGDGPLPALNELVHIGPIERLSAPMRVRGIETGAAFTSTLTLIPAAPQIETLTDAEVPPDWSGRVGSPIVVDAQTPMPPRIVSLTTAPAYTGGEDPGDPATPAATSVSVHLAPASGNGVALSGYRVEHRAPGGSWTVLSVPAGSAQAQIAGYITGDVIELRSFALSFDGTESLPTPTLPVNVGGGPAQLPGAVEAASIMIEGGLGHARLTLAMPPAPASEVVVYRVPFGEVLDRDTHALPAPLTGAPGSTITYIDGDATRRNLLTDPSFASGWTLGTGWSVANEAATHAPGSAGDLTQAVALDAGSTYHVSLNMTVRNGGALTPKLTGTSALSGDPISAAGIATQSLICPSGQAGFALAADTGFDGQIKDAALYLATAATLTPGSYRFYFEPRTAEGLPGPLSNPFTTTIL